MKKILAICLALALTLFAAAALADGDQTAQSEQEQPSQADHVHDFVQADVMLPTCTENGYVDVECSICKLRERQITPAYGHDWQPNGNTQPSTCVQAGWSEVECANCHEVAKLALDLAPHQWTVQSETKSTCAVKGVKTEVCAVCQQTRTTESPLLPHVYSEWSVSRQATDHSAGQRVHTCAVCGNQETEAFYPEGTLMRGGQRGDAVKALQSQLIAMGFLNDVADGIFGKNTEQAVKLLQQAEGLTADGVAWPQTIEAAARRYQSGAQATPTPFPLPSLEPLPTAAPQAGVTVPEVYVLPGMAVTMSDGTGCVYWSEGIGIEYVSCCEKHVRLVEKALKALTMTDKAQRAYVMKTTATAWNAALDEVYAAWAAQAPAAAQIAAARDAFHAAQEAHEALFKASAEDAVKYRLFSAMVECTRVCAQLHAAE